MAKAQFISIEGIEGVGKSTAVTFLADYLAQHNIEVITTREPGGTEIAEAIRQLLLAQHQEPMMSDTELLLMFAGRAQHIAQKIKPALAAGQWVISDRFVDASFAYQGGGRGLPMERIATLANWVHGDFMPDLTLLFDAPVETGFDRVAARGNAKDRFEQEGIEFFQRIREAYLARSRQFPQRFRVIQAKQTLANVQEQVVAAVSPLTRHCERERCNRND